MLNLKLDYASPSAYEADRERALLGLSAETGRRVRFKGKVRSDFVFLFRTALRALGELIWSEELWQYDSFFDILDPIITVHPDKIFLEAFSQDQSAHGMISLDRELFEPDGEVICGTSNIDFTAWLWSALGEMRTSRTTWFHLDNAGLELTTVGGGGRFERKVEVPNSWVAGFLQVQAAASMPGTRIKVHPVDLLSVVRFLRYSKAKTSPRGIRYEFEPDQPVRVVLEPWEESFLLRDTEHNYDQPKITRLWGRRRLRLLEPLLPFAESAEVYLKGRGLPSFYQLRMNGLEFSLSLSGRSGSQWSQEEGFELLAPPDSKTDPDQLEQALRLLTERHQLSPTELAQEMKIDPAVSEQLLTTLTRQGRAFYQLESRSYRHRELFAEPLELEKMFPPSERLAKARQHLAQGEVDVRGCEPRETRKVKKLASPAGKVLKEIIYRDWCLEGSVAEQSQVEVVLNDRERIIFGKCGCQHFQDNLLSSGPCQHMLALRMAADLQRQDLPTSEDASQEEAE